MLSDSNPTRVKRRTRSLQVRPKAPSPVLSANTLPKAHRIHSFLPTLSPSAYARLVPCISPLVHILAYILPRPPALGHFRAFRHCHHLCLHSPTPALLPSPLPTPSVPSSTFMLRPSPRLSPRPRVRPHSRPRLRSRRHTHPHHRCLPFSPSTSLPSLS